MKITVSYGNRITIPKQICNELKLVKGDTLEVFVDGHNLVLTRCENCTDKDEKLNIKSTSKSNKKVGVRQIVSNLDEGKNYKTKKYSECGLVIRTKTKYLDSFCEECRGQLALDHGVLNHPCKYINIPERVEVKENKPTSASNKIIDELVKNINKAQTKLDKDIDNLSLNNKVKIHNHINKNSLSTNGNTKIQPVMYIDYKKCEGCGEFFDSGFLLDDIFRCKACAIEDFSKYLINNKKIKKKRGN